jgi:diacylglycerol O-acyltransferase / wax synthase
MNAFADTTELPTELGALDTLLHRGEGNPRTRSGMLGVQILDTTPDWTRFRSRFDIASRHILRLRQKVVLPTLPTTSPRWVVDPDFNLDYHVRRLRVPGAGTLRDVLDIAETAVQSPLDISRPLWSATLVEGLANGQAAMLLHMSHAVTDGKGGVELFTHLYDFERDPTPTPTPPLPVPQDLTPNELMRTGISQLPGAIVGGARDAAQLLGRVIRRPAASAKSVVDYVRATGQLMAPTAQSSPLLKRRSLASRTETIEMNLADLSKAAKAADGSVNDAYLAALCGALRRYHDGLGLPIDTLPMGIPVSLRAEDDAAGGNRFTAITLPAPVGEPDPALRIKIIRAEMTQRREEAALDVFAPIAPVMSRMPTPLLEAIGAAVTAADIQASNVPSYPGDVYIAGAKMLRQYGLGPLPGVAMMVILVSLAGKCCVAVRYDRASVTDEALFARCLQEGFDEVLELTGDPMALSTPTSFTADGSAM